MVKVTQLTSYLSMLSKNIDIKSLSWTFKYYDKLDVSHFVYEMSSSTMALNVW